MTTFGISSSIILLMLLLLLSQEEDVIASSFVAVIPSSATTTTSSSSSCRLYQFRPGNDKDNERLDKGFNLLELAAGRIMIPQGAIVKTAKETWKFAWQRMMAELAPQDKKTGQYQRPSYSFVSTNYVGIVKSDELPGRYHLYVGNPCPWCHRCVLARTMLGISAVGMTRLVDDPVKASRGGWIFSTVAPDPLGNFQDLRQVYDALTTGSSSSFQGRCTAPLLVDLKQNCIVSNESADIVRFLNKMRFDATSDLDLYPDALQNQIDETNEWVYTLLNNAVYQCGFSTTQAAYDQASSQVRQGLQRAERCLQETKAFLCGDQFTEADLRLLPTLLRFDGVYAPLFKAGGGACQTIAGGYRYPALHTWLQRCWALPGVAESIDLADACASYYRQLFPLNPGGIVPTPLVTARDLGLE